MTDRPAAAEAKPARGSAGEVLRVFGKLGLTSFGGPVAHLGYFRDELVTRRGWLDDQAYADLVALCQFLPGPTSSQVGFALGLARAGWLGALAAFAAFTLPSVLLLLTFAMTAASVVGPFGAGVLHGLKIVAVAIVAQAVRGMAASLCPDRERAAIALAALALLAFVPASIGMAAAVAAGAAAGLVLLPGAVQPAGGRLAVPVGPGQATLALAAFAALLLLTPLLAGGAQAVAVFGSFFRAGALVFGGGHVVLPLLEAEVVGPGWVSPGQFLAGYGMAQAAPGPLFAFAAYLGALLSPGPNGVAGALLATAAIFLPGFLVLVGALPFWERLRRVARAQALMQGANAAVVGILAAALYDPVFTGAIHDLRDFALAAACLALLLVWRLPPAVVVMVAALGGGLLGLIG